MAEYDYQQIQPRRKDHRGRRELREDPPVALILYPLSSFTGVFCDDVWVMPFELFPSQILKILRVKIWLFSKMRTVFQEPNHDAS